MGENPPTTSKPTGHPTGLWFFFWGEFAERASYYGMRAILIVYMTERLGMADAKANEWYSYFKMACYLLPLLGGFLADRYLGKYWTIVGFSVPYVIGQLLIGIESETTVLLALTLCAMGSGVIKPNISALLGQTYDQKRPGDVPLRQRAFLWFYFAINIGATISMLTLPLVRKYVSFQAAFLVPAALMAMALAVFALGKKHYATETTGPAPPMSPEQRAEQWRVLASLFGVFGLVIFFWVVYEHNDIAWTFFSRDHINRTLPAWLGGEELVPEQFQFINGLCVLLFIIFFQWFWPAVDPTGKRFPATTKILLGFVFTASAPATLALAAGQAVDGYKVSMLWIVGAYVLLTLGEVLLYGTMLDVSYAYAPARSKGFVTACFLLTNTLGNLVNSQYGKMYYSSKLAEGEAVVRTLDWGAYIHTPKHGEVFRFFPEVFFSIDTVIALAAAAVFYFVGKQFNRANAVPTDATA